MINQDKKGSLKDAIQLSFTLFGGFVGYPLLIMTM